MNCSVCGKEFKDGDKIIPEAWTHDDEPGSILSVAMHEGCQT